MSSRCSAPDPAVPSQVHWGCFPAALDADNSCPCAHSGEGESQNPSQNKAWGRVDTLDVQSWHNCHVSLHPSCLTRLPGYLSLAHLSLLLSHQSLSQTWGSSHVRISGVFKKVVTLKCHCLLKLGGFLSSSLFAGVPGSSVQIRQSATKEQQLIMQVFWQGWDVSMWRFVGGTGSGRSLSAKLKDLFMLSNENANNKWRDVM